LNSLRIAHLLMVGWPTAVAGCGGDVHLAGEAGVGEADVAEVDGAVSVLELIGDPVRLEQDENWGGAPLVEWMDTGWIVAWGDMGTGVALRMTDAAVTSLGPVIVPDARIRGRAGLAWMDGRMLVAAQERGRYEVRFGVAGPAGTLTAGPSLLAHRGADPDVVRSTETGIWILGYWNPGSATEPAVIAVQGVTAEAEPSGVAETVAASVTARGPRLVALPDQTAAVWIRDDAIMVRAFRWPDVSIAPEPSVVMPAATDYVPQIEATSYGDRVAVCATDGRFLEVAVTDPETGEVVAGPTPVAETRVRDRRPGIAAEPSLGFLAVCYATGPGPTGGSPGVEDGVSLRLVSSDAEPIGDALPVALPMHNAGGCAVGVRGRDVVVVYWRADESASTSRVLMQRIRIVP
jgi:hypothetical protein